MNEVIRRALKFWRNVATRQVLVMMREESEIRGEIAKAKETGRSKTYISQLNSEAQARWRHIHKASGRITTIDTLIKRFEEPRS